MVEIFSNVAGQPLDSEKYFSFFKEAAKLKVTVLIHPGRPVMMESVRDYGLSGAVGFSSTRPSRATSATVCISTAGRR
jgi:predicted TIM-barrel fold metal-dependent hydrolase